ncbi:ABC transporter ATP-binding protein [Streptomyces sp. So13.3]|uniref:ABC transporter ATP-binding protein n=1 Tax=Streptomyces sp. So13.3 TaxID=2136173 RepID=UPI00110685FB|nr:ABC transporter ATP-binding protein [Streptomyces sp. So13.3]QNA77062.1 ABC transporter ATP-binding protein [Streptomyces sp. So13.3]
MSAPATHAALAIEADGLYLIYRERDVETVALRGAEISLPEGAWTSLMGPSGSGKSTLIHVLGGLLDPSGGRVLIRGEDLTRLPQAERALRRRRHIGMILQRDNLHPLLDVAGNVALTLRLDGRPAAQVRARVAELLARVGLSAHARQPIGKLSGGEAQRVAIAAALAPRPDVLLTDEVTGELDEETAGEVLDLLADVRAREGTAILTVTHNPLVAERADRMLRMRDGIVIEAGRGTDSG